MDLMTIAPQTIPGNPASIEVKPIVLDPLAEDCPYGDTAIITTRRAITRVALVAVETGGRFQREGIEHDPMSWMLAPRRLFNGRAAIDACLEREHCLRSILVHGLSLGLDLAPTAVDTLLSDDEEDKRRRSRQYMSSKRKAGKKRNRSGHRPLAAPRLFTATIIYSDRKLMLQAFHASIAHEPSEISARLCERFGHSAANVADIREGFHQSTPVAMALVQEPVAELIRRVAPEADHPLHNDFAVTIEQRIDV